MFEELKRKSKPIQSLLISSMSNGYIVNAGCVTLIFPTADHLVAALADYLRDPEGFQREHELGYGGPQTGGGLIGGGTCYPPMAGHPVATEPMEDQACEPAMEPEPERG